MKLQVLSYFMPFIVLVLFACTDTADKTANNTQDIGVPKSLDIETTVELEHTPDKELQRLYDERLSDEQVLIKGTVVKNLPDDNEGARHQKFILELNSGQTVLVAHNIDLADRLDVLEEGDEVEIFGEYEWNDRGGVIHWTHHDPDRGHVGGWIRHEGLIYE